MLVVDRWTSRVPIDDTWTYERGPALTKEDLFGQWRTSGTTDGEHMTLTLTIGESCSYRRDFVEFTNDETSFIDAIGESCELDIEDLFVSFVISRVDVDPTSVWNAVGQPLTFAVAPRARSAGLAVSGFWNDQVYDYEQGEWQLEPNPDYPYGGYNLFLEMVADAESALD